MPSGLSGVVAIAAEGYHNLALRRDGTAVAWGDNTYGQGNVPHSLDGVITVAEGVYHSLALEPDGTVVAWGDNLAGQATVVSGLSKAVAVAVGSSHSLALKQDGTVVAWGDNSYGQTNVPSGLSGVTAIAAGAYHSLALKNDGTVVAWGGDWLGQADVPGGLNGVVAIAGGFGHSLALKQDGTVVAWGDNSSGQTNVPSSLSGVVAVAAGDGHSVALKQDGTVVVWGENLHGETMVPSGLSGVVAIRAGGNHSLALKRDGTVVAWGDNSYGQTNVPSGLSGAMAIAAAGSHSLALVYPGPLAPIIKVPPETQTAETGSTIGFSVVANQTPLPIYSWFFNGTNALSSGTNSFLDLPGVQPSQAGAYSVVISNVFGAVTSSPALLSVIPPVPKTTVPAINLTGEAGSLLHLSCADTPGPGALWQELIPVTLTATQQFYPELTLPLPSARFYRAWQTTVPSVKPALQMIEATEITLTGAIGSHLRIDCINRFGPTDAWVTLDTATLTNTTQPYFDYTMFCQPARLYRLVAVP